MNKKRVLITGGTGFVGANLARRLLEDGHTVCLLVRPSYKNWRISSLPSGVEIKETELNDQDGVQRVISAVKPDWVFHLAAYGAYSWQSDFYQMIQTNIIGTVNLVNASVKAGVEAFVNTGSSSEYGFKDHAPSETEPLEPNSEYAVTKAGATQFCRFAAQKNRIRIVTLRLYSVYGPYEEAARFIPALIMYGAKGRLPPLVNPKVKRDFVYAGDVCEAYIMAATRPLKESGPVFNAGTGIQTSISEAVDIARRIMDIKEKPEWGSMPDRNWDTNVWVADNRKIQKELGWKPHYTFKQGFQKTLDWFRDSPGMLDAYRKMADAHMSRT